MTDSERGLPDMEWQQLEYFYTVAQMQHFTEAARKLSISQPALSRSIAKLERELGIPLFDRQGRSVTLNRNGRQFYARTARIIQEMEEARRDLLDAQNPQYGNVSFAFLKSLGVHFVPRLIRDFLRQYPRVSFQLYQNSTSVMIEQLMRGEVDFCLSSHTTFPPEIVWSQLWTEQVYVFVHKDHPLAQQRTVALGQIADERFIVLKQGYGSREIFDRLVASTGIQPHIAFEGEEVVGILGFVAANLGIALLPELAGIRVQDVVKLTLADYPCNRTIGLAWRKEAYLGAAAQRFREFLIEYCAARMSSRKETPALAHLERPERDDGSA